MRGARFLLLLGAWIRGIIPADAGSTVPKPHDMYSTKDHPRGCGEHLTLAAICASWSGSSPRMRGAHPYVDIKPPAGRIIPADAGSTRPVEMHGTALEDHPRGCGEHG